MMGNGAFGLLDGEGELGAGATDTAWFPSQGDRDKGHALALEVKVAGVEASVEPAASLDMTRPALIGPPGLI